MALKLYLLGRCSLRGTASALQMFFPGSAPSKSTISNWLRKAGYAVYQSLPPASEEGEYALILDESMVVGQQRMLYGILIHSRKSVLRPLVLQDALATFMAVRPSWKAPEVKDFLVSIQRKIGGCLRYIISDTDSTLCRAIADLEGVRICDVGHQIALFLKQGYGKQADFNAFTEDLAQVKFREIMKPTAYLLPPQARTQARFMNLSYSVEWAEKMLKTLPSLPPDLQKVFDFLALHKPLIEEFKRIFYWVNPLLHQIKTQGISHAVSQDLNQKLQEIRKQAQTTREITLIDKVSDYLQKEKAKIPQPDLVYHASSDIIESIFGFYKDRQSQNKLNGVTPSVLLLSLRTRLDPQKQTLNLDVKKTMETVSVREVERWKQQNLTPNQVQLRRKTLKR
jgi:hypothetical protein